MQNAPQHREPDNLKQSSQSKGRNEGMSFSLFSGKGQEQILCYVSQQDCMLSVNSTVAASAGDCCLGDGVSFRTAGNETCEECVGEDDTLHLFVEYHHLNFVYIRTYPSINNNHLPQCCRTVMHLCVLKGRAS